MLLTKKKLLLLGELILHTIEQGHNVGGVISITFEKLAGDPIDFLRAVIITPVSF